MNQLQQIVVSFFTKVIDQDPYTLEEISRFQSEWFFVDGNNTLVFSLSALHQFLCDASATSYDAFKRLIYQSNINKQLSLLGGKIEIYQSTGKVNSNIYKLTTI